jgi:ferredoxin
MNIDQSICTNCAKCKPFCPVGAIIIDKSIKRLVIDQDLCVECGVCYRANVCESGGLGPQKLTWPRTIRAALSDPLIINPETRIPGRGTEEMKTNDITGRFKSGHLGIAVEMGRPGISTSFRDLQKIAQAVAAHDVEFCPQNPVTFLMTDKKTGTINPEVLNERVLSGIIEFEVPLEKAAAVLETLRRVSTEIDTVFSLDIISLVEPDGCVPFYEVLAEAGIQPSPNGKNNLGLGRPAYSFFTH